MMARGVGVEAMRGTLGPGADNIWRVLACRARFMRRDR